MLRYWAPSSLKNAPSVAFFGRSSFIPPSPKIPCGISHKVGSVGGAPARLSLGAVPPLFFHNSRVVLSLRVARGSVLCQGALRFSPCPRSASRPSLRRAPSRRLFAGGLPSRGAFAPFVSRNRSRSRPLLSLRSCVRSSALAGALPPRRSAVIMPAPLSFF